MDEKTLDEIEKAWCALGYVAPEDTARKAAHEKVIYEHLPTLIAAARRRQGHREPCHFCGGMCNGFAGNPGLWPIPLCHSGEPGIVKWHHSSCISERLIERDALRAEVERLRELLGKCREIVAVDVEVKPKRQSYVNEVWTKLLADIDAALNDASP